MRDSEIYCHAVEFRAAILACMGRLEAISLRQFPFASCGDASDLLGVYLSSLGLLCVYTSGSDDDQQTHAWLDFEETIIDITADQFCGNETVIVTRDSDFHAGFDVDIRRQPSLEGAYGKHLIDLQHDYDLILSQLRERNR